MDNVFDARLRAMELLAVGLSAGGTAERVGVSRQTVQKWKTRFEKEGKDGLLDRSRAPLCHANAVSQEMEAAVLKVRRKYDEGPKKLRVYLQRQHKVGDEKVPSASTIGRILKKHNLVAPRPKRRPFIGNRTNNALHAVNAPNDVWCVDYKGEFHVGGQRCHPFTATDAFSRYALTVDAQKRISRIGVSKALWRCFQEYGLPRAIRSDNGAPFGSTLSPGRISRLATEWIRLGIALDPIEPGKPGQNGTHERFHRTLKKRTANPPQTNMQAQQQAFDRFVERYNHERPHESLGMKTPAEVYIPSPRPCPERLPAITHPSAEFIYKVADTGRIIFRGHKFRISKSFTGQTVGLRELDDDLWDVTYGPISVAVISFQPPEPVSIMVR